MRSYHTKMSIKRDESLFRDPKSTYASIRRNKRAEMGKINTSEVGQNVYIGDNVPAGFYESILNLKTRDKDKIHNSKYFIDFAEDYYHITQLCKDSTKICPISE